MSDRTFYMSIVVLLGGLMVLLAGAGLLGTVVAIQAHVAGFSALQTGLIMAGYYAGFIAGSLFIPRLIRHVGHIHCFAAFAGTLSATCLAFGLWEEPTFWFLLRVITGACVVGIYMVVESWLNEQSAGPARGRIFSLYMISTLLALGAGQFLLLTAEVSGITLFALSAIFISLGMVPITVVRVRDPVIELIKPIGFAEIIRISPLGMIGSLLAGVVNGAFWGMAPLFGQQLALDETGIAFLMATTIFGGVLLQWPIGVLSDRFDRRHVLLGVSLVTALLSTAMLYVVYLGLNGLFLACFFYGGLMFSLYSICVAHTNDHADKGQVLGVTQGLLLVYGVGALAGPIAAGMALQESGPLGLPLLSAIVTTCLSVFALYRMRQRPAPALDEQAEFVVLARTSPVALEMHPQADQHLQDEADTPPEPVRKVGTV